MMTQWEAIDIDDALLLLSKDFRGISEIRKYAIGRLEL